MARIFLCLANAAVPLLAGTRPVAIVAYPRPLEVMDLLCSIVARTPWSERGVRSPWPSARRRQLTSFPFVLHPSLAVLWGTLFLLAQSL